MASPGWDAVMVQVPGLCTSMLATHQLPLLVPLELMEQTSGVSVVSVSASERDELNRTFGLYAVIAIEFGASVPVPLK